MLTMLKTDRQHKVKQGMLTAYVNLTRAFDSIFHKTLRNLKLHGNSVIFGLLHGLLLWDREYCEVWERQMQFLLFVYLIEAGLRLSLISFQHLYGLNIRYSLRTISW